MDQILHRKLINEKNNLQLEVAKANKEIAKLMETVQQYEAVLASLNEAESKGVKIPEKIRLRGKNEKAEKKEEPKPVQEATLVRGMEAAKLKAQMSGKKLPTAAEAAKQTKKIEAEKELDQAGLGKLKKSRLQIDEVLDTAIDKKVAGNVAKHSLKQVKDEQKMLGRMPGVTPARMTLLTQQQKNRESLMNRLGKKQGVQEGFKDFVKDMGSQLKTIGKDALANVKKDMGTMKAKVSPANIKAGVKALPGKIEAAAQKMPTQQQNINFVKNNVVPMVGRVATEMNRSAPKNVQKRNASIGRILKP
jgi:hypothetical protein